MIKTFIEKIKEMDIEDFKIFLITTAITGVVLSTIICLTLCSIVSSICAIFGGPTS